jgi:hypothetical protein
VTGKALLFADANRESPIVYGSVIGRGGQGVFYRLANGRTFKLTAAECGMVKPRWSFEEERSGV